MKYYCVLAKCGHVGKDNYIPINFPIKAESGKMAAAIARSIGRVKHDHKDAILNVREINYTEYLFLIQANKSDTYLQCSNIQEQRCHDTIISDRILPEEKHTEDKQRKQLNSDKTFFYGKTRVRNVKRFMKEKSEYGKLSRVSIS